MYIGYKLIPFTDITKRSRILRLFKSTFKMPKYWSRIDNAASNIGKYEPYNSYIKQENKSSDIMMYYGLL